MLHPLLGESVVYSDDSVSYLSRPINAKMDPKPWKVFSKLSWQVDKLEVQTVMCSITYTLTTLCAHMWCFHLFNEALCLLLSRLVTILGLELAKESILTQLLGNPVFGAEVENQFPRALKNMYLRKLLPQKY